MIVLAVGMPRAGSGWHYNLTHDLMLTRGATHAHEIRRRYRLGSILTKVNCNIGALTLRRLAMVLIPSLLGHTFTIKVHSGPTPFARWLIQRGQIRPTYIYRDPRDALLSAYEYGQRARDAGRTNAFAHLTTLEKAIHFMKEYVDDWNDWLSVEPIHPVRYEDLKDDYRPEAVALAQYLRLDPRDPAIGSVIDRYAPGEVQQSDRGLHFRTGVSGRFRDALTDEQQELCRQVFGQTLAKMGYQEK